MATATTGREQALIPPAPASVAGWDYRLALVMSNDGRRFDAGVVAEGFLMPARRQAEFLALRRRLTDASLAGLHLMEQPVHRDGHSGPLAGVSLHATSRGGTVELQFTIDQIFQAPAQQALAQLVKSRVLAAGEQAALQVTASPSAGAPSDVDGDVEFTVHRDPLPLGEEQSADLLARATPQGPISERDFPIVLPRALVEKARALCRQSQREERGAMIMGGLFGLVSDPREIVGIAHAVLELRHARQSRFGFEPTTESFVDLQKQQQLRRDRLGFHTEVPLVLLHSHPFEPSVRDDGEANCNTCPLQPTCQLTSSFYSASDVDFHLSMFGATPWTTGMVIGLTPRHEEDLRMFCLDGNTARERGFYWIDG